MEREGTKQGGESRHVPVTLSTLEFMRSWCLHIQPDQLTKTRYFGGWSNSQQASYQQRCINDMNAAELPYAADAMDFPPTAPEPSELESDESRPTQPRCPQCEQSTLRVVSTYPRPSWREVFSRGSKAMPSSYPGSLQESDRSFWDGANGEGFYDWYLKHPVEGAYTGSTERPASQRLQTSQMYFTGLEPRGCDAIE